MVFIWRSTCSHYASSKCSRLLDSALLPPAQMAALTLRSSFSAFCAHQECHSGAASAAGMAIPGQASPAAQQVLPGAQSCLAVFEESGKAVPRAALSLYVSSPSRCGTASTKHLLRAMTSAVTQFGAHQVTSIFPGIYSYCFARASLTPV